MAEEEGNKVYLDDNSEWDVETELHLFQAMLEHKPVGINKHFNMVCICNNFEILSGQSICPDAVWTHLKSMFDLAALEETESLPFPNEEEDYDLPECEFSDLIESKLREREITPDNEMLEEKPEQSEMQTEKVDKPEEIEKEKKKEKKIKDYTRVKEKKWKEEVVKIEQKEEKSTESSGSISSEPLEVLQTTTEVKKEKKKPGRKRKIPMELISSSERDDSPATSSASSKKTDDDLTTTKKEKGKAKMKTGKRALRSRVDEDSSSQKSVTPPQTKRARRI